MKGLPTSRTFLFGMGTLAQGRAAISLNHGRGSGLQPGARSWEYRALLPEAGPWVPVKSEGRETEFLPWAMGK